MSDVWCFGANHKGVNKLRRFVEANAAFVGYSALEAPAFHEMMDRITVGSIAVIKSFARNAGLHIKAAGIVTSSCKVTSDDLGTGLPVDWQWVAPPGEPLRLGRQNDVYDHVRGGTLYQEFSPTVLAKIIRLLRESH